MKTWAPESTVTCRYSAISSLIPGEGAAQLLGQALF
jgi:hypothetical protein